MARKRIFLCKHSHLCIIIDKVDLNNVKSIGKLSASLQYTYNQCVNYPSLLSLLVD